MRFASPLDRLVSVALKIFLLSFFPNSFFFLFPMFFLFCFFFYIKELFLLFLSPLAQSELAEMSQPISCGIQRERSHYWLMRRRGIEAFILITVMCVSKRGLHLLSSSSSSSSVFRLRAGRGKLICGFRFISMMIIRSCLHLALSVAAEPKPNGGWFPSRRFTMKT